MIHLKGLRCTTHESHSRDYIKFILISSFEATYRSNFPFTGRFAGSFLPILNIVINPKVNMHNYILRIRLGETSMIFLRRLNRVNCTSNFIYFYISIFGGTRISAYFCITAVQIYVLCLFAFLVGKILDQKYCKY